MMNVWGTWSGCAGTLGETTRVQILRLACGAGSLGQVQTLLLLPSVCRTPTMCWALCQQPAICALGPASRVWGGGFIVLLLHVKKRKLRSPSW